MVLTRATRRRWEDVVDCMWEVITRLVEADSIIIEGEPWAV
jgi:hypothetical protein